MSKELIEQLRELSANRKPYATGAHGQIIGMESYRIVANGFALECIDEAADRIEELERERDAFYMDYRIKCDEEAKGSALVIIERDKLRAELLNALAACKAKDEALNTIVTVFYPKGIWKQAREALTIQPDDSALKAWLGEPVAWEFTDAFGTHYTDDRRDWMDTPGIESVTPLYSPKGLVEK